MPWLPNNKEKLNENKKRDSISKYHVFNLRIVYISIVIHDWFLLYYSWMTPKLDKSIFP